MIFYIIVYYYMLNIHNNKLNKRIFLSLIIFLILVINSTCFNLEKRIIFLDIKGDSTFISDSFNRCNILIDTGEPDNYDSVLSYLHSINVRKLDFLFITHFHNDHYGEMDDLITGLSIDTIITTNNVDNFSGELIGCGSLDFYIYDLSKGNRNENNNSLIVSLFIANKHYLFTGDAEMSRELEFMDKYSIEVDYLKVAHHGSITSSSADFIDSINPKEAYIMVYRNNRNNHPDLFVVNRFEDRDIPVYRTDLMGSIEIKYFLNYERKKYYKP